jgi:hypothetical protein
MEHLFILKDVPMLREGCSGHFDRRTDASNKKGKAAAKNAKENMGEAVSE